MNAIAIADARRFSLAAVQRHVLADLPGLTLEVLGFEAGQRLEASALERACAYQVLEGEALVRHGEEVVRLGKGKVLPVPAGTDHALENAGGGLLVVLATHGG
jgi:mannose-6-phosphate isomerase-like protein (cupin superfamily)